MPETLVPGLKSKEAREPLAAAVIAVLDRWAVPSDQQAVLLGLSDVDSLRQGAPLPGLVLLRLYVAPVHVDALPGDGAVPGEEHGDLRGRRGVPRRVRGQHGGAHLVGPAPGRVGGERAGETARVRV